MPKQGSAEKRDRQNKKRRTRNRGQRTRMRTLMQEVRETEDKDEAEALYKEAQRVLDRLATKGVIHENKASNYKRKLAKHVASLSE